MENRRPITYTFEDIKRYKQGLMNREEMHAFEKASMEDPFLADALEGFMEADMALADEHLSNIRERITDKKEEKDKAVVVAMPQKRFGFMRVAAMIIVIAGAGLLTYQIFDKKEVNTGGDPIAEVKDPVNEIKPGGNQQSASPTTQDDSIKSQAASGNGKKDNSTGYSQGVSTNAATNDQPVANGDIKKIDKLTVTTPAAQNPGTVTELREKETRAAEEEKVAVAKVTEETNANDRQASAKYKPRNNQNQVISGRVVSTNNQPLANANIRLDNSRNYVVTDQSGNFLLNSKDSLVVATVETPGFLDTRVELRSNANNTINLGSITLQPDPAFNDIAVTGLGTSKKKQRVADTLTSKPEGGWESFQQYVANKLNIQLDTTGRDMKISGGELEIEFFVDANGVPKDFKVLNSTNPALNNQAINAVKQGPKWATRKKKARILIRY